MMQQEANTRILSELPLDCPTRAWTSFKNIRLAASEVLEKLSKQQESGNQFLVVVGLNKYAIDKLLREDREALGGIEYRFTFEGTVGLIKVIPSSAHDCTTANFRGELEWEIRSMGVQVGEYQWGTSSYHPGNVTTKAKELDECFWPGPRRPRQLQWVAWPTLVIETGLSESLPRLREDARWWFTNSGGETRIVLLFAVRKQTRKIVVEKWQLAPPGTPSPLSRTISSQLPPMPPLVPQPATAQKMYCAQELTITPTSITGAPLIIHFQALMDRVPVENERDVVLNHQALAACTRHL